MLIKLTLEYEGTNYSGWQLQAKHDTVQGRIEKALGQIFSTPVRVYGSGRTDTGVHARGQVAAITIPRPFDLERLKIALNSMLPRDIVVLATEPALEGFDPRRSARSRIYEYRVLNRPAPSVFERRFAWHVHEPLNMRAINAAARVFIGEHDFVAFRKVGSAEKSTVRRVTHSRWSADGELRTYRIEANSYLRHQVRTMVAAMVECGRGRLQAADVAAILESRDRGRAPASAPPQGLFLVEVRYSARPDGISRAASPETSTRQQVQAAPVQNYSCSLGKIAIFERTRLELSAALVHAHPSPQSGPARRRMMTQSQVAAHIADKTGINKKQAKQVLEEINLLVVRELKKEGSLRIAGLGIFRKRKTKARMGRNPATGQEIKIPARTRLRFTAAKALKDSVLGTK